MSLSNYIRRTKGEDREDINRLLGVMSDIFYPEPEEGSVQERIILGAERRIRTLSVTDAILDVTAAETRNRYAAEAPTLQMPTACESYPLSHSTTGTLTPLKTTNTKYGGGMSTDGSSYITITDDAFLDTLTTDISIAFFLKPKAHSSGDEFLVERNNAWKIWQTSGDTLNFAIHDGSYNTPVTYDYTSDIDSWISVVCRYNTSNGQEIHIDNVSQDADNLTGNITTGSGAVKILGNGTNDPTNGTSMAWLHILDEEVTTSWITGFHGGFFDWSGGNLITCIPFVGDETVWAEATSPFCVSS